jgi:hypothetical protein
MLQPPPELPHDMVQRCIKKIIALDQPEDCASSIQVLHANGPYQVMVAPYPPYYHTYTVFSEIIFIIYLSRQSDKNIP